MYERVDNSLAVGVCFNNIANLQFKNARYQLAYENYVNAITQGIESELKYQQLFDQGKSV
jgi:hypothetical protein